MPPLADTGTYRIRQVFTGEAALPTWRETVVVRLRGDTRTMMVLGFDVGVGVDRRDINHEPSH